jgi:cysteine desulfurase/selenocysteine lyase
VPVNLSWVDVYSAATFKWVLASFGFAILATSERARSQFTPAFRGGMNTPPHLNYSHPNYAGIYAMDSALDFLDKCEWGAIYEKVRSLAAHLSTGLRALGHEPRASAARTAGIVSFETSADLEALNAQLQRRGLQVTLRGTHVRVSPHFYNDQFEIDQFLQAMRELRPAPPRKSMS